MLRARQYLARGAVISALEAKHAGARNVSIVVMRRDRAATAIVEDDGEGFDPADERKGGFGLVGMRERIALLDGRLEVESSSSSGTTVVAEVPVP